VLNDSVAFIVQPSMALSLFLSVRFLPFAFSSDRADAIGREVDILPKRRQGGQYLLPVTSAGR
jgi:hypothetical protein